MVRDEAELELALRLYVTGARFYLCPGALVFRPRVSVHPELSCFIEEAHLRGRRWFRRAKRKLVLSRLLASFSLKDQRLEKLPREEMTSLSRSVISTLSEREREDGLTLGG
jgi:GT2 family glycosyltransferase